MDLKVWLVSPEGYQMQIGPALGKGHISKSMMQDEFDYPARIQMIPCFFRKSLVLG
jgi:hypothetical protein